MCWLKQTEATLDGAISLDEAGERWKSLPAYFFREMPSEFGKTPFWIVVVYEGRK
ncbi:hypothetical protein FACS18949_01850 [Clostridia bacterium]|nr:hypothetical protein FACS18949_01850 [Clostridia bacterium]